MFKKEFLALCARYQETKASEFRNAAIELAMPIAEKYVSNNIYFSEVVKSSSLSYDDILSYAYEGLVVSVDKYLEADLSTEPQNYITLGMLYYTRKYISVEKGDVEEELVDWSDDGRCIDYATHAVYQTEIKEVLDSVIDGLTVRENAFIRFFFSDENITLGTAAAHFGVSRERVRQLLAKAFRRLRQNAEVKNLHLSDSTPQTKKANVYHSHSVYYTCYCGSMRSKKLKGYCPKCNTGFIFVQAYVDNKPTTVYKIEDGYSIKGGELKYP